LSADPSVIGARIKLDGHDVSIIGVIAGPYAGLQVESETDVVALASGFNLLVGDVSDPVFYSFVLGRLRDDATIDRARADVAAVWPGLIAEAAPSNLAAPQQSAYLDRRVTVQSAANGFSFLRTRYAGSLSLLAGLTIWMIVIASVNLAGALLAGAAARESEFRVRAALGASPFDLGRQMIVEGGLLVAVGTLAGLPFVLGGTPRLLALLWPTDPPLPVSLAPDWRVLAISVATLATTTLVASVAPAWLASRRGLAGTLANTRTLAHAASGWERGLLVAEIALSLVMLAGAGLFIRTLANLRDMPLGFDLGGVMSVSLMPRPGAPDDSNDLAHARELVASVTATPGIAAAGFINHGLMLGVDNQTRARVAPASVAPSAADPSAMVEQVSPGFFKALSVAFEQGRDFAWSDGPKTPPVAIVTATEAARLFPGESAMDRHIRVGADPAHQDVTIVGVVADSRLEDLREPHPATVFLSLGQRPGSVAWSFMQVRADGDPAQAMAAVRARVDAMGHQSVERIGIDARTIDIALARERLAAWLGAVFATIAIGLVAIGSYGLFSHWVTRRTRELGVRMALGASATDLRRWVFRQSVGLTMAGLAIGLPAVLIAGRLANATTFLFGLSPHDPVVLISAAILVLVATALAVIGPASRVFRLDPLTALRSE
jgi:predicted permease